MTPEITVRAPIAVLLSTYNGARFLRDQLDSLWNQTWQDFEVVVRDDGSSDSTMELLRLETAAHPGRVHVLQGGANRLGPKNSFASLMERTSARWIAFCDQDDAWLPDKLQRQAAEMERMEAINGIGVPILICGDAIVTDAQLRATDGSYFARHAFSVADGRDVALARLIFRNYAIGATTMINAALAKRCRPMPDEAIMHDWWCALVASAEGCTSVLPVPLMNYRQHGGNAIGSRRHPIPGSRAELLDYVKTSQASAARCVRQAQALRRMLGDSLAPAPLAILDRYRSFAGQSQWQRATTVWKTRAFKPGLLLNMLHLYACITTQL